MWKKANEPRCAIFQPEECGWFVDNSREKPILKPTFFNGGALPQTINEILEDKANSDSRTDGFLIDANDIIGIRFPMNLIFIMAHLTKTCPMILLMINLRAILYSKFTFTCELV